ncbi:MAG: metal ABC transporter permease [Nodosilinea sp.]
MDWLLDPLSYDFMRQALMASVLVGILCPIIGTYLIVQRMAMLGDVVAHGVLPGLAIASFLISRFWLGPLPAVYLAPLSSPGFAPNRGLSRIPPWPLPFPPSSP